MIELGLKHNFECKTRRILVKSHIIYLDYIMFDTLNMVSWIGFLEQYIDDGTRFEAQLRIQNKKNSR
jgi:hypothetical protein